MREIRKESLFYFHSGGGVTLSGGDILLQADFAAALLKECKQDCIHTMAELDLFGAYDRVAKLAPLLDACFVDVKHMDSAQHKRWTGVDNETILQNLLRLSSEFPQLPLHIRVPLIPGVNDSEENILATAEFCRRLTSCQTLEFLPNLPHYFLHCHKLTIYAHSMGGAYVGTAEAFHAFCPVMDQCCPVLRDGQRLFGACPDTAPTVQTLRLLVVPFRFGGLSLRCGAPRTAQRAAF